MSRFLGDGAGVWSGKVFSEDDGVNVFEDDEHVVSRPDSNQRSTLVIARLQLTVGAADETVVKAIPFESTVGRSVLNSLPVTQLTYPQV